MKIKSDKKFKSLDPFHLDKLPNFIVISGINGAGKTHLLQGIQADNTIKIFDDNEVELKNKKFVKSSSLAPNDSVSSSLDKLKKSSNLVLAIYEAYKDRKQKNQSIKLVNTTADKQRVKVIEKIAKIAGKEVDDLINDDFFRHYPLDDGLGQKDVFKQNLSEVFKRYILKKEENEYNEFRNKVKKEKTFFLTNKEFLRQYGEPPWNFVNSIIQEANLDYHIPSPADQHRDVPLELKLVNNFSKTEVRFSDLSGGEKVLMSLALSLYNSTFDIDFPEVLLMDEPDAPLHPSMTKQFINVIENVFVKEKGVKVILTTHSPSTVAIAPDSSLFHMDKVEPRLSKTTKDKALRVLTSGVPSLSFNYENRRQVFVESKNDVVFYEKIYEKIKEYLVPEISINFISSGVGGNGNCDQVRDVVNKLTAFGNNSIYGIIDWDLKNNGNDFVLVLGENQRYSIENFIFDPLLLGAYLIREKIVKRSVLGLSEKENYTDFVKFRDVKLQVIADKILALLASHNLEELDKSLIAVTLINNRSIELPKWFLHMRGHELEKLIKDTFKPLNKFCTEAALKKEIIEKVIDDIPEVLPFDLIDIMKSIQGVET